MRCPFCGHGEDRVIDSRASNVGDVIRRRRECESCERRFTTYERVEYTVPAIVKKDGRREPFDRQKIIASMSIALSKRPVSSERIAAIADEIERDLALTDAREIPSAAIGEKVMTRLRELDEVGYVRFASVYRSFRDIGEFAAELGRLAAGESEPVEPRPGAEGAVAQPERSAT